MSVQEAHIVEKTYYELTKKYDMEEDGDDCDVEDTVVLWDNGCNLSYEITQEIKRQIRELLKK